MNTETGTFVEALAREEALAKLREIDGEVRPEDVVMIQGELEAVEKLSQQVKMAVSLKTRGR